MRELFKQKAIVAVDNPELRDRISKIIEATGFVPVVLKSSYDLRKMGPVDDLVFIETNDDVAALTQTVYELYRSSPAKYTLWIVGLLSKDAMERNPRSMVWDIDGHAALLSLLMSDHPDLDIWIEALVRRLKDRSVQRGDDLDV